MAFAAIRLIKPLQVRLTLQSNSVLIMASFTKLSLVMSTNIESNLASLSLLHNSSTRIVSPPVVLTIVDQGIIKYPQMPVV
jgi:hypothetical protein